MLKHLSILLMFFKGNHHGESSREGFSVFFLLLFFFSTSGIAQTISADTLPQRHRKDRPVSNPARAAMFSASLPGMGQVYNRKYWKVPIIYAGFGTLAYFVDQNNTLYQRYRAAYIARIDGNPNTIDDYPFHSTDVLERAVNIYRRNLEVTYLLAVALYLLNILDANVDAHLMDFDVGERLSFGMPLAWPPPSSMLGATPVAGLTLRFRF